MTRIGPAAGEGTAPRKTALNKIAQNDPRIVVCSRNQTIVWLCRGGGNSPAGFRAAAAG